MAVNRTSMSSTARVDDPDYKVSLNAPLDSVRWAAVLAGMLTFFATLAGLTVLGIALSLSTFETGVNYGIGAGIYGGIAAFIAFFLGGFIAARTAAVAGRSNAILNGAMVWIASITLIVNVLGAGVGSLLGTAANLATDAATTAVTAASNVAGGALGAADEVVDAAQQAATAVEGNPELAATAEAVVGDIQAAAPTAIAQVQAAIDDIDEGDVEQAARDLSGPAWAALLALGITALASILGGLAGTRTRPTEVAEFRS